MAERIPVAMARFDRALLPAGAAGTVLSLVVLGMLAFQRGLPFWMPLNVTSHAVHGVEAAQFRGLDMGHTGLGFLIHAAASFFWSLVAILILRPVKRGGPGLAWTAGLATAVAALLVDYVLLPRTLSPGWHLILSPLGVALGFAAMGVGISLGLMAAQRGGNERPLAATRVEPHAPAVQPNPGPMPANEVLRHPEPTIIDQRQQRIDPTNEVTLDPNDRGPLNTKQPGGTDIPPDNGAR